MASKHDQNRAEKRDRLLGAAVEAFTETGFENTTVSDVVHRAGMTPSTFYNYFRDKDALKDELLGAAAARMLAALAAIKDEADGPEACVRLASRRLFSAMVEDRATASLLRRNLGLLRSLLDDKALAPVYARVRENVEAAVGEGRMEASDPDYAVAVLRASWLEMAVLLLARPEPDVDGAVDFLAGVIAAAFRLR